MRPLGIDPDLEERKHQAPGGTRAAHSRIQRYPVLVEDEREDRAVSSLVPRYDRYLLGHDSPPFQDLLDRGRDEAGLGELVPHPHHAHFDFVSARRRALLAARPVAVPEAVPGAGEELLVSIAYRFLHDRRDDAPELLPAIGGGKFERPAAVSRGEYLAKITPARAPVAEAGSRRVAEHVQRALAPGRDETAQELELPGIDVVEILHEKDFAIRRRVALGVIDEIAQSAVPDVVVGGVAVFFQEG